MTLRVCGISTGMFAERPGRSARSKSEYAIFIVFAPEDELHARWIQRAIERFRIPRLLRAGAIERGVVHPRQHGRLGKVRLDPEPDIASVSADDHVARAVRGARTLIVVCSPHAAASARVDFLVRHFKSRGASDRVLCLLVSGEPNAIDHPERGLPECLAEGLRYQVDQHGALRPERADPVAADVRAGRGARDVAAIRIVAGLLGVGFDDLWQRERRRRVRSVATLLIGLSGGGLVAGLSGWHLLGMLAARTHAEIGRRDVLDGDPRQGVARLAYARAHDNSWPLTFLLARVRDRVLPRMTFGRTLSAMEGADVDQECTRVVTTDRRGAVRVWRLEDGTEQGELAPDIGSVVAGATARISADGLRVALADDIRGVRVHDLETGLSQRVPTDVMPSQTRSLIWSPDGARLTMVTEDSRIYRWGLAETAVSAVSSPWATEPPASDSTPVLSSDREKIALLGRESVSVWDVGAGARWPEILEPYEQYAAFLGPNILLTASEMGTARLWNAQANQIAQLQLVAGGLDSQLLVLASSENGEYVATANRKHLRSEVVIDVVRLEPFERVATFQGHWGAITGISFECEDRALLTTSEDGTAKLWTMPTQKERAVRLSGKVDWIRVSSRNVSVAATEEGQLFLWDLDTATPPRELQGAHSSLQGGTFASDGERFVSVSASGAATVWDVAEAKVLAQLEGTDDRQIWGAATTQDSSILGVALIGGGIDLWDLERTELRDSLGGGNEWIAAQFQQQGIDFSRRGTEVSAVGYDGTLWLWRREGPAWAEVPLARMTGTDATAVRFGKRSRLAVGYANGWLQLLDARSSDVLAQVEAHRASIDAIAISDDGNLMLTTSALDGFRLWEAETLDLVRTFEMGHEDYAKRGWFFGDNAVVLEAIGSVELRTRADETLASYAGSTAAPSADGDRLVVGDWDRVIAHDLTADGLSARQWRRLVRCHLPWWIEDEDIARVGREPSACIGLDIDPQ